jgi:hypothetical protein
MTTNGRDHLRNLSIDGEGNIKVGSKQPRRTMEFEVLDMTFSNLINHQQAA